VEICSEDDNHIPLTNGTTVAMEIPNITRMIPKVLSCKHEYTIYSINVIFMPFFARPHPKRSSYSTVLNSLLNIVVLENISSHLRTCSICLSI